MRIYLAGPLFTAPELKWNEELAFALRRCGHDIWLPQERNNEMMTAVEIFDSDVGGMDWCEAIVACLDQADPDSGTSWELGYCWKDKFCYYYRSDLRNTGDWEGVPINLMLDKSTPRIFPQVYTTYSLAKEIDKVLSRNHKETT